MHRIKYACLFNFTFNLMQHRLDRICFQNFEYVFFGKLNLKRLNYNIWMNQPAIVAFVEHFIKITSEISFLPESPEISCTNYVQNKPLMALRTSKRFPK